LIGLSGARPDFLPFYRPPRFFLFSDLRLSDDRNGTKAVAHTAREFAKCMAVMVAGDIVKAQQRKPKRPRYAVLNSKPIEGKFK
jgi:hypothetical protein